MSEVNDTHLGPYVYCGSHVGPHLSGWCTVPAHDKLGLPAETDAEANEWVKALGLPWYGHCGVCYKWILNEDWYRQSRVMGPVRLNCPEHTGEEQRAATLREQDLRRYLRERYVHSLDAERNAR